MSTPDAIAAIRAIETVIGNDRGRILAALIARVRDFQLAEDALQDAATSALAHWSRSGVPVRPEAWLIRVAFRKAIDRLRAASRDSAREMAMAVLAEDEATEDPMDIPDDRLRLIFTCCHPALEPKSRVALTLRTIAGLTTAEIARAFLDAEPTMGQRLSRAKAKIAAAGIPFRIPDPDDWPDRLNSVLTVVYLIYNAGYTSGPATGHDLCHEAIFLARLLTALAPDSAEVEGCLALLLLTHARAAARISPEGQTLPPGQQDRTLWDAAMLAEGRATLDRAVTRRRPGPFQIKAAIAALHTAEGGPDWPQIAALYARLHDLEPTAVIRLNHAVAMAEAGQLERALSLIEPLADELADYQPFHAASAELYARSGAPEAARTAYGKAIAMAASAPDRAFLRARLQALR
ncbi:MAG: RNA polymerase [Tabrizicola sp.]|nr:RNA polymerase [Tabrizicola sp.]